MKKRTLRSLSTEIPDPDEVEEILLRLSERDDRTAAILGASLVESALQECLVTAFRSSALGLERNLFENRGPLSDFNSKILVGQAFEVITDRMAEDLQRIRKIRNCFAHARTEVQFEEPLIAAEVTELGVVLAARKAYANSELSSRYQEPKLSYGLSCYITYTMLKMEPRSMEITSIKNNPSDLDHRDSRNTKNHS